RSPLWAGGGTIFGPQPRDYTYRLPKSARQAALRAALAARHAAGKLLVVDGLTLPAAKTKHMVECLAELGFAEAPSVLVVLRDAVEALCRVTVGKVRTSRPLGKTRRVGRHLGRRPNWQKAYVTLAEGSRIDFFEGA